MRKALLVGLCFVMIAFLLVSGTFGMPDLDTVFTDLTKLLGEKGLPEVGGAGTAVDVSLETDHTPQNLYPGGSASRATSVRNEGNGEVYFRLVYAVQYDAESWPLLNITFAAGEDFSQSEWRDITIGSTPYRMKAFTYTKALAAKAVSPSVTLTIAMDESITSEQMARYRSDFVQTQALAIDPTPFAEMAPTAEKALELALPLNSLNPF